jgi:DNA-binding MarR family transcriptional regulator
MSVLAGPHVAGSAMLEAIAGRFRADPSVGHMLATTALLRATRIATERTEAALAPLGLTMMRYEILGLIDAAGGRMALRDLKRATMLHAATMTYTINWLSVRGLVERREDPENRRIVLAELTSAGQDTARAAMAALTQAEFGLPDLNEAEAWDLAALLARVRRRPIHT